MDKCLSVSRMQLLKNALLGLVCLLICYCQVGFAATTTKLLSFHADKQANGQAALTLNFDAAAPKNSNSFVIKDANKLVIDLPNTESQLTHTFNEVNVNLLNNFTVITDDDKTTRLVLDLKEITPYNLQPRGNSLTIIVDGQTHAGKKMARATAASSHVLGDAPRTLPNRIKGVDFKKTSDDKGGQIIITLNNENTNIDLKQRGDELVAEFLDTSIPSRLQRKLDVSDFSTPVNTFELMQQNRDVLMTIMPHGKFEQLSYQVGNQFIVDVTPVADKKTDARGALVEPTYTGERISLNFQSIKVRAVLQLLAEFTGLNVVTSDSVDGEITLRLHNVPWDQALDIILKAQGLAKRKVGNVLLIAPAKEMAARETQELSAQNQIQELAPLYSELLQINFANAKDIAALLQSKDSSLLSNRGKISVDERTNTIWLQDTALKLREIRDLVHKLDIPVRQVLIEARIVNVDRTFERDLGIMWGFTKPQANLSGNFTAANELANNITPQAVSNPFDRLNVNLPVASSDAARVGVALANLGNGYLLDMELSALESEGKGELVASPRAITANKHKAHIESGEEIPYQVASSSGATTVEFKKAVLSLDVTPQITPDNKIILSLDVHQDKRSSQPEVLGVPAIDTESVQTQVLVNNGGTVVLGGIYQQTKNNQVTRVPFLGSLPLLGHLFRRTKKIENQSELLIFITPKVIQQGAFTE